MNYAYLIIAAVLFGGVTITVSYAQNDSIPIWVKNTALWYGQDAINDDEFFGLIQFLLDKQIITVPVQQQDNSQRVQELENELSELKRQTVSDIQNTYDDGYSNGLADKPTQTQQSQFPLTIKTNK